MGASWRRVWVLVGLVGCRPVVPEGAPRGDAAVASDRGGAGDAGAAVHVCYGAAGSAVELPRGVDCATVGASDTPPAGPVEGPVRVFPRPRRDAGPIEMF
ncbi:MAG: hypothetical protein JNK72_21740 [Myxococcales bacterium]|nr:hypothetical protein [Myxococcales bacterium]